MTAYGTVEAAVAAMKEGAYDFITKPVKRHAIVKTVRQALEKASLVAENRALRARLAELSPGASGRPARRRARLPRGGRDPAPGRAHLRHGAPHRRERHRQGAGGAPAPRPLAARAGPLRGHQLRRHPREPARVRAVRPRARRLHRRGRRARKGASSGPTAARSSSTRSARCRPRVQAKLLRVLQDGELRAGRRHREPCGSTCASWPPPTATSPRRSRAGRFREDLFYRLNVVADPAAAAARAARGRAAPGHAPSCGAWRRRTARRRDGLHPGRAGRARSVRAGRGTCASCSTPSSAR